MFSLLLTLFFSVTGITLNHPEWTFGIREAHAEYSGTLPSGWKTGSDPNWLKIAEFLRDKHHLHGIAKDNRMDDRDGSLSFKAPGYSADCNFDVKSGEYKVAVTSQGPVNVLNDLHRGRDTEKKWNWMVDASGIFLVVISLTGLGILLYLKKMRTSALVTMVFGILVLWLLMRGA